MHWSHCSPFYFDICIVLGAMFDNISQRIWQFLAGFVVINWLKRDVDLGSRFVIEQTWIKFSKFAANSYLFNRTKMKVSINLSFEIYSFLIFIDVCFRTNTRIYREWIKHIITLFSKSQYTCIWQYLYLVRINLNWWCIEYIILNDAKIWSHNIIKSDKHFLR